MTIHLTHDSVAMSNDIDAPHEHRFIVPFGQRPILLRNQVSATSSAGMHLHFRYYTQQNPEEVLAALR